MRKLLAICGVFLIFGSIVTGQNAVNYTVKFKPLQILDQGNGDVIARVPRKNSLVIHSYNVQCDCFMAKYLDIEGVIKAGPWLADVYSKPSRKNGLYEINDSVKRLINEYRLANDKGPDDVFTLASSTHEENTDNTKILEIISRWGYTDGKRIAEGKIWIGMSVEMALESWGIPYRVNITRGSWGIREQWIYTDAYLHFENGILSEVFRLNKNED